MPTSATNTIRIAVIAFAALCLLFFLKVSNPSGLYFLNDDFVHIPVAAAGDFFHGNLLRPVSDMTLWVDYLLWGKNAFGFHLTNVLIHLANAVLCFKVLLKIFAGRTHALEMSMFAAALFLVYAFHSESVFWIIGRGGSLAAFFMLVSLYCYLRSKDTWSLVLSLLSFAAGLFAYEFVWIMPVIIVVFQSWDIYNQRLSPWKWSLSFLTLFFVYLLVRYNMPGVYFSDYETGALKGWQVGKLASNYAKTIARCFLPPADDWRVSAGLGLIVLVTAVVVIAKVLRSRKTKIGYLFFPLLCFLFACLPSVSLGIDTHDTEGERFLYVPSIFFCWLLAEAVFLFSLRSWPRIACMAILLMVHSFYLNRSSRDYRYASGFVKNSLHCIFRSASADTLIAEGLPTQYNGALIFRTGFANALGWIVPGKYQMVEIRSFAEVDKPVTYHCTGTVSKTKYRALRVQWLPNGEIYFSEAIR